ncbi:N-hydroxyarylamine O-acetyltransferase [Melghirimyces profundicolus]|uniref:N-hydroxyarylamine O-acetyltransferase n=1 Tax=Melghirimyces profundicolus TaxID=1242148 RepID=A0A2T6BG27_9BACL|nr:arylamine N-acetyltransferase [Melghirimyces profundicolus]PTX55014.1 N-hydroxyarylamine O-acetyltransferase [Melghirimyces profundicolus]
MNLPIGAFFNRIQYNGSTDITFSDLPAIQRHFALTVPFENNAVMAKKTAPISLDGLREKIIDRKEGGLCYELNPLFYSFLKQLGFDVHLVAGTVFVDGQHNDLIGTHVATLLHHNGRSYIVDVGFGSNLALQPVPLSGEPVTAITGEYRVREVDSPWGDYAYEKYSDKELTLYYTFSTQPVDEAYLSRVRDIILTNEKSKFNKSLFFTKLTDDGHITLTEKSFTITRNGHKTQQEVDKEMFHQLGRRHFGMNISLTDGSVQALLHHKAQPEQATT